MTKDEEAAIVASAVLIDALVQIELMSDEAREILIFRLREVGCSPQLFDMLVGMVKILEWDGMGWTDL